MLKLYGAGRAIGSTFAVVMTLVEKQIPFEIVPLDIANRQHRSAEHLAIQPFGQFPVIVRPSKPLLPTFCIYL
jgi:glutathione S-transferase